MANTDLFYQLGTTETILFLLLIVWVLFWKGWALWTASKEDSKKWFIALLVLNTVGILPILYLFVFSKKAKSQRKKTKPKKEVVLEVEVGKE